MVSWLPLMRTVTVAAPERACWVQVAPASTARVLGPEQPCTLLTRNQLVVMIGEAGDAAEARDQFAGAAAHN